MKSISLTFSEFKIIPDSLTATIRSSSREELSILLDRNRLEPMSDARSSKQFTAKLNPKLKRFTLSVEGILNDLDEAFVEIMFKKQGRNVGRAIVPLTIATFGEPDGKTEPKLGGVKGIYLQLKAKAQLQCFKMLVQSESDPDLQEALNDMASEPDLDFEITGVLPNGLDSVIVDYDLHIDSLYGAVSIDWEVRTHDANDTYSLLTPTPQFNDVSTATQRRIEIVGVPDGDFEVQGRPYFSGPCAPPRIRGGKEPLVDPTADNYQFSKVTSRLSIEVQVDPCNPLKYTFTLVDGNKSVLLPSNVTGWSIEPPNSTTVTHGSVNPVTHTFDQSDLNTQCVVTVNGSVTISVNGVDEQISEIASISVVPTDQLSVDFEAEYTACDAPFMATFTNISAGKHCPINWIWTYHDGTTSSGSTGGFTYNTAGSYSVTLTAHDPNSNAVLGTKTKTITAKGINLSLSSSVCNSGLVTLKATGTDIDTYKWTFPTHSNPTWLQTQFSGYTKRSKVRLCYPIGLHTATCEVKSLHGGICKKSIEFRVTANENCCRRTSIRGLYNDPAGSQSRIRFSARSLGRSVPFVMLGTLAPLVWCKVKFQKKRGVFWIRARAGIISASFGGNVSKIALSGIVSGNQCPCGPDEGTSDSRSHNNRAIALAFHVPTAYFSTKQGAIEFKFRAQKNQVDINHSVKLGNATCTCKGHTKELGDLFH